MNARQITVVIPAKNEARSLAGVLKKVRKYAAEIIVVDGKSSDGSHEIAKKLADKVIVDAGRGKGLAMRSAIRHISNKITVFMDADGSHNPADIPILVKPIVENKADHVSGSRLLGGSGEFHGSFNECFRLMGSSFITAVINHRFGVRISDSQNGFRAIKTDVLKKLDLREKITTIEQEMIIKTLKNNYRIVDVPTFEARRKYGNSCVKLSRVSFRYIYTLIKYCYL